MLLQPLYDKLCSLANSGKLLGVLGGPMCRTWSIRRHIPKPRGGLPLRSRSGQSVWGLPDLCPADSVKVAGDNVLLFRQLYLSSLAMNSSGPMPAIKLEHPADPAWASSLPAGKNCCSIWDTKLVSAWISELKLQLIHFDQCNLGQVVPKTTTLATNLPLCHWKDWFCSGLHEHGKVLNTSDLSRYPPNMMKGIAEAVRIHSAFWESTGTSGPDDPRNNDRPSAVTGATPSDPWHHKLLVDLGTSTSTQGWGR